MLNCSLILHYSLSWVMKPFSSESQELCQIHLTVFYTPGNSVQWVEPLFVISPFSVEFFPHSLHLYLSDYVPWLAANHCQSSMNYTCFCYWFIYSHSPFFSLFSFFFLSSLHLSLLAFIFFVSHFSCSHYLSLLPYFLFSFSELTLLFHPLYSLYTVSFFYASFLLFHSQEH